MGRLPPTKEEHEAQCREDRERQVFEEQWARDNNWEPWAYQITTSDGRSPKPIQESAEHNSLPRKAWEEHKRSQGRK